jgi:ABC-2 type transport system permease protein
VVLGKVLGGTLLAAGQGLVFLILAPLVGFHFTAESFLLAVLLLLIVSFALTSLGFCLAWQMTSTQGFHAIMNLFLMPLWFLSGALFPAEGAWWGLAWIMALNPLTYGVTGLRHIMAMGNANPAAIGGPSLVVCLLISCAFAATLYALASFVATRHSKADLA